MEKQSYMKPFMVMEKFLPQEFVAGCNIPHRNKYITNISALERDNIAGWSDGDNEEYNNNSYRLYFDTIVQFSGVNYKTIHKNTYPYDKDISVYYEYQLSSPGVIVLINGNTYKRITSIPSGTTFYSSSKRNIYQNNAPESIIHS